MTKPLNGHVLSSALDTLVKSPLNQADDAALVSAAKAVWYSNSNLESEVTAFLNCHTDEVEVRRAGYLLERFTRFACVSDIRVSETLNALVAFCSYTTSYVERWRHKQSHRCADAVMSSPSLGG